MVFFVASFFFHDTVSSGRSASPAAAPWWCWPRLRRRQKLASFHEFFLLLVPTEKRQSVAEEHEASRGILYTKAFVEHFFRNTFKQLCHYCTVLLLLSSAALRCCLACFATGAQWFKSYYFPPKIHLTWCDFTSFLNCSFTKHLVVFFLVFKLVSTSNPKPVKM